MSIYLFSCGDVVISCLPDGVSLWRPPPHRPPEKVLDGPYLWCKTEKVDSIITGSRGPEFVRRECSYCAAKEIADLRQILRKRIQSGCDEEGLDEVEAVINSYRREIGLNGTLGC